MKHIILVCLFIGIGVSGYAQLDVIKPTEKTPKKSTKPVKKVTPVKPLKPINTASYIIVFRGGQFASALTNYSILIDGKLVCKLSNDRYFKYPVSPGKHEITAKKSGVDILKKETFATVLSQAGKDNYISCNIKTSLLKQRLEMIEVVESSGKQSISGMKEDNCQEDIGHK